jgi:hypothetical protein
MVRRKKQQEPNGDRQSPYKRLVVVTVPCDPPLEELPSAAASWRLEAVPFPLSDACAAGCPARQNDGGNILA